jgi:hypothetical protein
MMIKGSIFCIIARAIAMKAIVKNSSLQSFRPLIILDYFVALLPAPVNISSWKYFINGGVYSNYLLKNTSTMQTI